MKGFIYRLRDIWVIFGITLLLVILVEVFFKVYYSFDKNEDSRMQADYFQNKNWVNDYFEEFNSCNIEEWHSYVYWRRKPFTGNYININQNGFRNTVYEKEPAVEVQPKVKIFMFGGSTMWGTGVRDEYTIPSFLGEELGKKKINAEVFNFGESGYVSSQEILALQLQLQQGNIPDVVVFYDGVNDVFSAFQQGVAGIPQNEFNRKKEFNASREKKKSLMIFLESLKTLNTYRFIKDLTHHKHGFKVIFYWQPTIFNKLTLSEFEKKQVESIDYIKNFSRQTSKKIELREVRYESMEFYDISDIFLNESEPVFIDYCHVSEYGNTIIAERIVKDILKMLRPEKQNRPEAEVKDSTEEEI